jgi:signal transduction histidine kinase
VPGLLDRRKALPAGRPVGLRSPARRWASLLPLAFVAGSLAAEPPANVDTSRILIINSYHPGYPWTDGEMAGILDALRCRDPGSQPFVQYLDCKHCPEEEYSNYLSNFLKQKYRAHPIALIITTDNPALEFMVRHRDAPFGGAPVVFCGVNGFSGSMLAGQKGISGVAEVLDAARTLEIALRLHPRTREIVVLHDYTVTGLSTRKELEAVIPRFADRVKFRFIEDLPMDQILRRVEELNGDRLLLVLSFAADKAGQVFPHDNCTRLLSDHSRVPVYGVHELRLGYGIVGGCLLDARLQGARAAEIALRVLEGEDPSRIPVDTRSTSRIMFDYNQLARFGIPVSALPAGSVVLNQPESFYRKHSQLVVATGTVIAALTAIVCVLLLILLVRRRAEEQRRLLIGQLETKNAELERFVYTVSHDLRSPLVTIKGFLGLLERDAGKTDARDLKTDITHISNAAERMNQLLGELLEFSRIGRTVHPVAEVPLADVAREALALVAGQITERGVTVDVAPDLPVVRGDRRRLMEVFQNLIDNAVKFMGDQERPHVEIGLRREDDRPVYYVRDNGIGIDPRYQEKVFDLFERLDPRGEGAGVGLAIVKRIVELHGGRVWVESQGVGKGCTFCFTLPPGGGPGVRKEMARER